MPMSDITDMAVCTLVPEVQGALMSSACPAGSSLEDTAGPHAAADASGWVQMAIAEQLHSQLSQSQV